MKVVRENILYYQGLFLQKSEACVHCEENTK